MTKQIRPQQPNLTITRQRCACFVVWTILALLGQMATQTTASAKGEPAEAFVKQLRNAGYFDTAISYLERAVKIAGVDPDFVAAIPLEKANTYIDAALNTRNTEAQDKAFSDAEKSLQAFVSSGDHPRIYEARLQLGKLQMIRGAILLGGEPDDQKRSKARESYLAASKTFDQVVQKLRVELEKTKGQKIDPKANPEADAQRKQYRFEYLQSQLNAADAIKLAAMTRSDPLKNKDSKSQLEDAMKRLTELQKKYASYRQGAIALMHLGDINEALGKPDEALDNYLIMLEQPDVDELREAKFRAATGMIRLKLAAKPPKYEDAIGRTAHWSKEIRPDESSLAMIQAFRVELAKAYLLKSADKKLKKGEIGRAKSAGRDLLLAAKKIPGPHVKEVDAMLADLGIEQQTVALPTAEPPKSFDDAMEKATQIVAVTSDLDDALKVIKKQKETPQLNAQISDIEKQLAESYSIGIQILRGGLVMVTGETNTDSINQARQILAYFLYRSNRYRETIVVGNFLARNAPGSDVGLQGGLMALTSMQMLLSEIPDDENAGLIRQLESLGNFLASTWPNDPNAAAAQGLQIRLLLKKDDFDGAQALIDDMSAGSERAGFKRLLGQLFWNQSIMARVKDKDEAKSSMLIGRAKENLLAGLNEIEGNLVEAEGMKAALNLAKILHMQGDSAGALKVLDHAKYGPLGLFKKMGAPSDSFAGELYSTELKALVGQMLADDNPESHLERMTATMEKLRDAFKGPESQAKLTSTYVRLAGDLKTQLDGANPARKSKLIKAFRVMLQRISESTKDDATIRWVGQTLMSMGESLMQPGQAKADGQAAELMTQSIATFKSLSGQDDVTTAYLLGRAQRLVGKFKDSINTFEKLLQKNPMMLEAQIEAATAYESWAATLPPNVAYKAYRLALEGARPNAKKKNTIWGWAEISKKTIKLVNKNDNFREKFFESRYHVALCLYLMGKASKRKDDKNTKKAIKVIRDVATLLPDLGGAKRRAEYDALMKEAQKAAGEKVVGLGG